MEDFDFLKNSLNFQSTHRGVETFLKLPRKAQEMIWAIAKSHEHQLWFELAYFVDEDDIKNSTPIEIIFAIAFDFYCFKRTENICGHWDDYSRNAPKESVVSRIGLAAQQLIEVNGEKYIVDFLFDGEQSDFFEWASDLKVVIECDGHDFHHKTKKQVAYDNERQLALQTAGYDVIRFSGSQIYKDPLGCAEKAYNFILSKIKN